MVRAPKADLVSLVPRHRVAMVPVLQGDMELVLRRPAHAMVHARMGDTRMLARQRAACVPESILTPKDTILEHLHTGQKFAKVQMSGRKLTLDSTAKLSALLAWAESGLRRA